MQTQAQMRIGVGLPAAVPGRDDTGIGGWAAMCEQLGFRSVSVIDRLVYDNLDPLVALAAAAARTTRIELLTTVLNVPYRQNAVLLAKQIASVDRLSGGRLTVGLAMGGWPEDYPASGIERRNLGATMDAMLVEMRRVWDGEVTAAGGPIPALPPGRPGLLFGGLVPAAFARAARAGQGWVAPVVGGEYLTGGIARAGQAWARAGRPDRARIVVIRYFALGDGADRTADGYLEHYYGPGYSAVRADTPTTPAELRLQAAGCDDVVFLPCSGRPSQVEQLASALDALGIVNDPVAGRALLGPPSDHDRRPLGDDGQAA